MSHFAFFICSGANRSIWKKAIPTTYRICKMEMKQNSNIQSEKSAMRIFNTISRREKHYFILCAIKFSIFVCYSRKKKNRCIKMKLLFSLLLLFPLSLIHSKNRLNCLLLFVHQLNGFIVGFAFRPKYVQCNLFRSNKIA